MDIQVKTIKIVQITTFRSCVKYIFLISLLDLCFPIERFCHRNEGLQFDTLMKEHNWFASPKSVHSSCSNASVHEYVNAYECVTCHIHTLLPNWNQTVLTLMQSRYFVLNPILIKLINCSPLRCLGIELNLFKLMFFLKQTENKHKKQDKTNLSFFFFKYLYLFLLFI